MPPILPGTIAIVGIGCRFPGGANTARQFWALLCNAVDAITEIAHDRFDLEEVFDPDLGKPGKLYTRWGAFIDAIDQFDAEFFGILPREAQHIDPQQRLLLEVVWEALEDGGLVPDRLAGTNTGVFVGLSTHDYSDMQVRPSNRRLIDAHSNAGGAACIAANRISYLFNFRGPSLAVDTACSSSLTAVHLACRSLASGECDLAIVGGVNAILSPEATIGFCKASMLAPDGRCKAFDARADGYVRSEGAGAVILKPLDRAIADKDPIYALIRGTAVNQDGRTTGMSVPSMAAQEEMFRSALRSAGVAPSSIQYVEAHGTGTRVGDPIEAAAVGNVFGAARAKESPCLIGSVKSNIGHLEAAAGIAGLIKAALALKHQQVPPSIHFQDPNPAIAFTELCLRVPTTLEAWPSVPGPAMAGVNSFGFGGTNAHVILEEPPADAAAGADMSEISSHILTISTRSPQALRQLAERYRDLLSVDETVSLRDLCYTAATRRGHLEHRLAVTADSRAAFVDQLNAFLSDENRADVMPGRRSRSREPRVAFVFPGMGPQWWGMGRQLLVEEPAFRHALDECDRLLRPLSGWSLLEELTAEEANSRVGDPYLAHVANFAIQIALTALWRSWGIIPDAVVGHSSGEMAASAVAGALELPEALSLAFHRGRLQQRTSGMGTMLAAGIPFDAAVDLIAGYEDQVAVAAVNSPNSVTLSGTAEALARIAAALEQQHIFCRYLPVTVPYHGPQMETIREEFLEAVKELKAGTAAIPIVSTVTGHWSGGPDFDAAYWWRNVRHPVRFAQAIDRLIEDGYDTFVEVGPHPVLAAGILECLGSHGRAGFVLPTLRQKESERRVMLRSLASLHVHGRPVRWSGVYSNGSCIPLPTYPWQRERYWMEEAHQTEGGSVRRTGKDTGHPLLGGRLASPHLMWEAELDDPRLVYLDDHVIDDAVIYPGAAYVETALAMTKEISANAPVSLEHFEFHKLLFLSRGDRQVVQIHYNPRASSIEVYSSPKEETSLWTLHATAQFRQRQIAREEEIEISALRGRCPTEIAIDAYYQSLERAGYRFGAMFRRIDELWVGHGEALARIELPADVAEDGYQVHPVLLDASFQLLAVAAELIGPHNSHGERPVVPVSIEGLHWYGCPRGRLWTHASVRSSESEGPCGDAVLIDDEGKVVVRCEGLRLRALDQGQSSKREGIDDWVFELRWEDAPLPAQSVLPDHPLLAPSVVHERMRPAIESLGAESKRNAYYDTVEPLLNGVVVHAVEQALSELGCDIPRGETLKADGLANALGVVPVHHRLFARLIEILQIARSDRDRHSAVGARGVTSTTDLVEALAREHPEYRPELRLLGQCGTSLAGMLRGDVDAREVLFTDESLALLTTFYHGSPSCSFYNDLVAEAVAAAIQERPDRAQLRVLEIGAGTGATTAALLPRLPTGRTEYLFTDVSPFFFPRARERFRDWPGLHYATLDIERDPAEQQLPVHTFDIVVAANVLHATADLRTTLEHARRLLAPAGLLVLSEVTRRSPWLDLIFGLLEGWWRFSDLDLRPSHPLLTERKWRAVLEERGFDDVVGIADPPRDGGTQATVLLSRLRAGRHNASPTHPAASTGKHWVIFADRRGVAARLAASLDMRGEAATLVYAGDTYRRVRPHVFEISPMRAADIARLFADLHASGVTVHALMHAWSLDAPPSDTLTTAALMEWQRITCGSMLHLVKALESGAEIWLITAGAQAVDGQDDESNVGQSPMWGLGRVLITEYAGARCRIVDLSTTCSQEEVDALLHELYAGSDEQELVFRGSRRFARQIHRASLPRDSGSEQSKAASPQAVSFGVEIGSPGVLDSIGLREMPRLKAGPGELLIQVVAAGLNFRSVLLALGMLPFTATEKDAVTQTLGTEYAGIVIECGEGATAFQPGDEVIALASGGLGSRIVAQAELVVPKPANLTFEGAASIPSAFLTAHYCLGDLARLRAGERVLIHAATGAVGLAAIQLARRLGAEIFATAGTPEKRAFLASLGIEHIMDSRSLAFADEIMEITGGEGVDVVLNSLGGEAIRKGLEVLRPYGRFVEIGKRDIYQDTSIGLLPFRKNLSFFAFDLLQLGVDRPNLVGSRLRDLTAQIAAGTLERLPQSDFDLAEAEQAFRLMATAKHIGKVVLSVREPRYWVRPTEAETPFHSDATYLITGGLGGLGITVANWMACHGAGTIVLMSRSGSAKEQGTALDALHKSSANVVVVRGDVSREEDVVHVLDRIRDTLPPLRGIIHAAMVLDDDLLVRLDEERFRAVLEPKAAGAWNLHTLTLQDELDFFILFSSATSLFGHQTQGSYSAGNAFLDALAPYRRKLGLPALTINWGAITGAGYVARHENIAQYLAWSGLEGFTVSQALATLEQLLRHDPVQVLAARIDWQMWSQRISATTASKPFVRFAATQSGVQAGGGDAEKVILSALRSATADRRPAMLEEHITHRVARVAGTSADKIDPERPLTEMGFDSLMTVELQTVLKLDFGTQLSIVHLLQGISIRRLVSSVLDQLAVDTPSAVTPVPMPHSVPDRDLRGEYPISYEQQRFWFLDQLHPGNPACNLYAAYRLSGELDVNALERSLSELVRRHHMLRAVIKTVQGHPMQVFSPPTPVRLPVVDLAAMPSAAQEVEIRRLATAEVRAPFDLARGPLYRFHLLRLGASEHAIIVTVHHIAFDSMSSGIFFHEGMVLYRAFTHGEPSPLPEPAMTYPDYVHLQQEQLTGEATASHLAYWKDRLAGAPSHLRLPTDRSRPAVRTLRGGRASFELSYGLSSALISLSRKEGVTLFMTLLAAFQTLLHRYSREEDITVGTPAITRTNPGTAAIVGCFMNTLALRTDLSGDPSFRELLRRVQDIAVGAFAHQDLPFEQVVQAIQPRRDLSSMPLFQTMLVVHTAPEPKSQVPGLDLSPLEIDGGTSLFDMMLLVETGERLHGSLEYSTDLFDAASASHLLQHFEALLESIVADPEQHLSSLSLLTDPDRRLVLLQWNDTAADFPEPRCLHELFEAAVERSPHAVAVESEDQQLTYQELNHRANQLANHLRKVGVGPDVLVGLYLEQSPEMVVALLGILKAGGAYVPLDPSYPRQHTARLLENAAPHILLTQQRLLNALPNHEAGVVVLDAEREVIACESGEKPAVEVTPDHLAYVMYTSGSTGEPKGVMIPHRGICNQIQWRHSSFPLDGTDAVLQRTPVGSDPSVWEFFGPLSAGARLIIPRPGDRLDTTSLIRLIVDHKVTTLQVVPSLLHVLLEMPGFGSCRSLKCVFCGGEVLTFELQERFFACCGADLHNLYGPTEASIDTTYWTCRRGMDRAMVPIGHPIANVRVYILDAQLQPVPAGVPGELYIGGYGVARGYLHQPELTAERFVLDRFSDLPGAHLYRTGDQARYRYDGAIEFLGRTDLQVKVRGFRVEPGEIEALLARHPLIKQAAVIAHEQRSGDPHVLAYLVAHPGRQPSIEELRHLVKETLPDFMQPVRFTLLETLPLLPSGKVDRRALPGIRAGEPEPMSMSIAPRDAIELQLVQIWENLFNRPRIGVADDFFELGGHSLLAMHLVARIRQVFGQELPPADLFQGPTIERLAQLIRGEAGSRSPSPLVAIQPNGSKRPFFCVHPTGGGVFCYVELSRQLADDQPFYALQAPGLDGERDPLTTIEAMAEQYIDAIQAVQPKGPYLLGGWSMGGIVAFEMARRLAARNEPVPTVALFDAWAPVALSSGGAGEWPALLNGFIQNLGLSIDHLAQTLSKLSVDEQPAYVLECARKARIVPPDMDGARLDHQLRVFTSNLRAVHNYIPQPYPGRITLFSAAEPLEIDRSDSSPRWSDLAIGGVELHTVPGNHYTMLHKPYVEVPARLLAACLDQSAAGTWR